MNMENSVLLSYISQNPTLEIRDVFKFVYQSAFGCEHLVSDYSTALERIKSELHNCNLDILPETEYLDGDSARVHLKYLENGLSAETLCRIFIKSSECTQNGAEHLEAMLHSLHLLAKNGEIPFTADEIAEEIEKWRRDSFPPIHHSDSFGKQNHPSYRVIKKDFLRILPLLSRIDKLLQGEKSPVTVAIDGRCASGKTTLSALLSEIYDCNIFHMDDFFLLPDMRTKERLSEPGENADHERFLTQVLVPISEKRDVDYIRYDCHSGKFCEPIKKPLKRLNIIEGVYSFHPSLISYYDLRVFLDISEAEQRKRILKRNPETADVFFSKWILFEEKYFDSLKTESKADLIIR